MPEEPADALVTEIPVTALAVVVDPPASCKGRVSPDGLEAPVDEVRIATVWVCPESVTEAVWVWLTTIALAEPPVPPTA